MFWISSIKYLFKTIIENKAGKLFVLVCLVAFQFNCHEKPQTVASVFMSIKPEYGSTHLVVKPDTLHFPLPANTYNEIKSFNYFIHGATSYLSFYDRRSETVSIYQSNQQRLIKQISLKKTFRKQRFYKTSVYTINFDSILVTNVGDLYLLDSSGAVKSKIPFVQENEAMAYFETPVPVIYKDNRIFMGIRPFVKETSLSAIRNWKIMYSFDFSKKAAERCYQLPPVYRKALFGRRFMNYSYCYNDDGRFVFSFPADSCIYETNFFDYHMAYYAKSRFQNEPIQPVSKEVLKNDEGGKAYGLRDSYGTIYYDKFHKKYIRIAKQKIEKAAYENKNYIRRYSAIVFDQHFKVISEFALKDEFSADDIFFTPVGSIYARVNKKDENALHFVRLAWTDDTGESMQLTKK